MNGSREDERVLDRRRILELFDELAAELRFSRTRGQIYILGGAAMSLAFSAGPRRLRRRRSRPRHHPEAPVSWR